MIRAGSNTPKVGTSQLLLDKDKQTQLSNGLLATQQSGTIEGDVQLPFVTVKDFNPQEDTTCIDKAILLADSRLK